MHTESGPSVHSWLGTPDPNIETEMESAKAINPNAILSAGVCAKFQPLDQSPGLERGCRGRVAVKAFFRDDFKSVGAGAVEKFLNSLNKWFHEASSLAQAAQPEICAFIQRA